MGKIHKLTQNPIPVGPGPRIVTLQLAPFVGRTCASASETVRNGRIGSAPNGTRRLPMARQLLEPRMRERSRQATRG